MDLKNPKTNERNAGYTQEEREKFRQLLGAGYIDTYRELNPDKVEYTWWSYMAKARERNIGWRIDYFLASESLRDRLQAAEIHGDVYGSDHCPVSVQVDI